VNASTGGPALAAATPAPKMIVAAASTTPAPATAAARRGTPAARPDLIRLLNRNISVRPLPDHAESSEH
jgi:hypothetical protein